MRSTTFVILAALIVLICSTTREHEVSESVGGEAPHTAWPMNARELDRGHPRAQKRRLLVESFCHNDPGSYDDIRQSESPRHLLEVVHENCCLGSSSLLPRQYAHVSR